jgi:hypothetical protein
VRRNSGCCGFVMAEFYPRLGQDSQLSAIKQAPVPVEILDQAAGLLGCPPGESQGAARTCATNGVVVRPRQSRSPLR